MNQYLVTRAFNTNNSELCTHYAGGFIAKGTMIAEDMYQLLSKDEKTFLVDGNGAFPSTKIQIDPNAFMEVNTIGEQPSETVSESAEPLSDVTFIEPTMSLEEARIKYEELYGKKPHHFRKLDSLLEDIAKKS